MIETEIKNRESLPGHSDPGSEYPPQNRNLLQGEINDLSLHEQPDSCKLVALARRYSYKRIEIRMLVSHDVQR